MVRLGVGQTDLRVGDAGFNLSQVSSLLAQAGTLGVKILVLPELANSGYAFRDKAEALDLSEVVPEGNFSRTLREWSRSGTLVTCGLCERQGGRLFNSAVVFANGAHLTTYRKIHLFNREPEVFDAGAAEPPVVEFDGQRYGVMICFEWAFPEIARILALKKAQVILHPANLVLSYCQPVMVARSIENRLFTATANRTGLERKLVFTGRSQITSPDGGILCRASADSIGVVAADIDPGIADDKMITPFNHVLKDRRPDIYWRLAQTG